MNYCNQFEQRLLFWHLWKLLHERQFQTEEWRKINARKKPEKEEQSAQREHTGLEEPLIERDQVTIIDWQHNPLWSDQ